jgi:hypothetical protein
MSIEICLDLPNEITGLVIGKKGTTIMKIQESSHAQITITAIMLPENKKLRRVSIIGSEQAAKNAQDQIIRLIVRWCDFEFPNFDLLPEKTKQIVAAYKSKFSPQITDELLIPRACVSYVTGENYGNIIHLERSLGVQIFPLENKADDIPQMLRIAIVGSEHAVSTGRSALCQVAVPSTILLDSFTMTVDF